jgi:dihydrofolate synthase / folylpolyglutamate synthase
VAADPSYPEVERALLARWPETRLDPSLDRIRALCDLLGDPQHGYAVVHLTGTNGKTSTSRMIDALLTGSGLRTGRYTSPHLQLMTERITLDGEPLTPQQFVAAYRDVEPYVDVVDRSAPHPMSFFEVLTGMAYAAFADAPVDAAVVEVGMGGAWDATNVADGQVAVVTPVAVDHAAYLGDDPVGIAQEKSGIIKAGAMAVLARQPDEVTEVLQRRAAEVGATVALEGTDFGLGDRVPGVGGQVLALRGLAREYDDIFLPLHGAHQAHNAACAVAAAEAFLGGNELDPEAVREALAAVTSPGRLEVARRSPTIVLDSAHNPHGAEATAQALQEAFSFSPLVGVVGVMGDKDVEGLLAAFEPVLAEIVCSQNSSPRALPAPELGDVAEGIFGADRVHVAARLDDAIDVAAGLAEGGGGGLGESLGSGGVLVTGSVVTVGEARTLLGVPPG